MDATSLSGAQQKFDSYRDLAANCTQKIEDQFHHIAAPVSA